MIKDFFSGLFRKNSIAEGKESERGLGIKDEINLNDPYLREQYVISCLEQMRDASEEIDRITAEYSLVTSYLTDMEEIDALPEDDREELSEIAKRIHELRKKHDSFVTKKTVMTEHEYNRVDAIADDIPDAIKKLTAEEDYKGLVKSDLSRLDKEKQAYSYRKREVSASIESSKSITILIMVATVALLLILFSLNMFLKWDVTVFYYITVAFLAISVTVVYIRYADFLAEKRRIESTYNELILLENKVKIRYVNNKNLLDYLYTKYEVSSAAELRSLYDRYVKEREERKSFERNEASFDIETTKLLRLLRRTRVTDPELWIGQSDALYDRKEMVEVKHHLIGRRQKLRKQLEYNEQIALEASDEVKDIIRKYPEAAPSLMEIMDKYEK